MASVTWSIAKRLPERAPVRRPVAAWLRFAIGRKRASANIVAGLVALVALPAAFAISLAVSSPLAIPVAVATVNLGISGQGAAARRVVVMELCLAAVLMVIAALFGLSLLRGGAHAAALAGALLSLALAALPALLRLLMRQSGDRRTALCRDMQGLNRLTPEARLLVVERGGRVAAVSQAALRHFAEASLKPGADLPGLIDSLDRPALLNALNSAGHEARPLTLRLNAERCRLKPQAAPIDLSLAAIDARTVIVRLLDPPAGPRSEPRSESQSKPRADSRTGPQACDLNEAVRFALRILRGDADKQGVAIKHLPATDMATPLRVACPPRIARQIALNLIGNAIAVSRAGGGVTVETRLHGRCGLFRVRDAAAGIAKGDRDAPLSPRRRDGKHTRPGGGLGLAIVGDLVAGCDGRIDVESAPGKATTVTVRLPVAVIDGQAGRADPHNLSNQSREIARAA